MGLNNKFNSFFRIDRPNTLRVKIKFKRSPGQELNTCSDASACKHSAQAKHVHCSMCMNECIIAACMPDLYQGQALLFTHSALKEQHTAEILYASHTRVETVCSLMTAPVMLQMLL
jgi:hypothetical protein